MGKLLAKNNMITCKSQADQRKHLIESKSFDFAHNRKTFHNLSLNNVDIQEKT